MSDCNHIIGYCENSERDKKYVFADGEQVDLIRELLFEATHTAIEAANHFLTIFEFCPLCGRQNPQFGKGFDLTPEASLRPITQMYSEKKILAFRARRYRRSTKENRSTKANP